MSNRDGKHFAGGADLFLPHLRPKDPYLSHKNSPRMAVNGVSKSIGSFEGKSDSIGGFSPRLEKPSLLSPILNKKYDKERTTAASFK